MSETRRLCGVPSERGFVFLVNSQGLHPGLVCDAPSGHKIGNEVDVEAERNRTGLKNRSERRSAPRPGSATHGYRRSEYETTTQAATPPSDNLLVGKLINFLTRAWFFFVKHSQGDALGSRIPPRWGLGRG
jgi:hypothetical protein